MLAQDLADCTCGTAVGWLILAGVAGSALYDVATNFYVWQRGVDLGKGRHLRHRLPYGLTVTNIILGAIYRALVAAVGVGVLSWAVGAVTNLTAAAAVGVALPAGLAAFAGIRDNDLPSGEGRPDE